MNSFALKIVTVSKPLFDGEAESLHCTGMLGQMTILAQHEPFITKLVKSNLTVHTTKGEEKIFGIHDGVLEVANNRAVVLCSEQSV